MLLFGVRMFGKAVDLGEWSPNNVINDTAEPAQFVDIVELADLHHVLLVLSASGHAARFDDKPGGVSDDGLLEADLGAIGKAGDHGGVLAPLFREALLCGRVSIGILKTFDVAHDARCQSKTFDPSIEIHLDARFIAFTGRENGALFCSVSLEDGPDGGVDLGVHQPDVFVMLEGFEDELSTELD